MTKKFDNNGVMILTRTLDLIKSVEADSSNEYYFTEYTEEGVTARFSESYRNYGEAVDAYRNNEIKWLETAK